MTTLEARMDRRNLDPNLAATYFIDSDNVLVKEFAESAVAGTTDEVARAVELYYAVRDSIRYDPYDINCTPQGFKASTCLERGRGFCITKAALLAACARVANIPSRVGFGDVKNHLATPRLIELMGTDEFVFHGYTELFLGGIWVKATPAFNLTLFDAAGRRHMEYIRQRGSFDDVPFDEIVSVFKKSYPEAMERGFKVSGADFEADAGNT